MKKIKNLFSVSFVALTAIIVMSSFTNASSSLSVKCVGYVGYCKITLPDGTVAESTGNVEVSNAETSL
jgi:hypothetical protein